MTFAYNSLDDMLETAAQPKPAAMQVLLVCQTPEIGPAVKAVLSREADVLLVTETLAEIVENPTYNLRKFDFITFETCNDQDFAAIRTIKAMPDVALHFIGMMPGALDADRVQTYLEAGVQEVLPLSSLVPAEGRAAKKPAAPRPQETTFEEVADIETKLMSAPPVASLAKTSEDEAAAAAPTRMASIIPVLRARGGAGASTVAVNLATELANSSKFVEKVLLLDLDIQNGMVATALDLADSPAFSDLLLNGATPDAAFVKRAIVEHKSGLFVLPAPDVFAPLDAINEAMMTALLAQLQPMFDHIIVDMPHAVTHWFQAVLAQSSRVLVVTDTAVTSIKQTKRLVDLISEDHMTLPIQVLVNREKRPMFLSAAQKEAERTLDRELTHWIPSDPSAARLALDTGVPLGTCAKRSAASKALALLAKTVRNAGPEKGESA